MATSVLSVDTSTYMCILYIYIHVYISSSCPYHSPLYILPLVPFPLLFSSFPLLLHIRRVLEELLQTEEVYVADLKLIVEVRTYLHVHVHVHIVHACTCIYIYIYIYIYIHVNVQVVHLL